VVLWTTVYLDAAVRQLKAQGYPVRDEDMTRLSPFVNTRLWPRRRQRGRGKVGRPYVVQHLVKARSVYATELAKLRNDSGPALAADSLKVGQGMFLSGGFTGGGDDVAVDLTGTRVGGTLVFAPARLEHAADPHRLLAVDGLTTLVCPGWGRPGIGCGCCGMAPPAMRLSRISNWLPGTVRGAMSGRPTRP